MIDIITIDKIKEPHLKTAIDLYLHRLKGKLKIKITEIPPAKYHLFDSIDKALAVETKKIKECINHKNSELRTPNPELRIIALDKSGVQYSSIDFSKLIYDTLNHAHITFIIGGAYGLTPEILDISHQVVSFSKMTFAHEMFRLMLLEQIYRAYTIENNIRYHN